jgi:hypothetical protein
LIELTESDLALNVLMHSRSCTFHTFINLSLLLLLNAKAPINIKKSYKKEQSDQRKKLFKPFESKEETAPL